MAFGLNSRAVEPEVARIFSLISQSQRLPAHLPSDKLGLIIKLVRLAKWEYCLNSEKVHFVLDITFPMIKRVFHRLDCSYLQQALSLRVIIEDKWLLTCHLL